MTSQFSMSLEYCTVTICHKKLYWAVPWHKSEKIIPWIYVTVPILCWPHSSIKIMNSKLFIYEKRSDAQMFVFFHAHSGWFVKNDWAQMKTELNKTCAFSLKRG